MRVVHVNAIVYASCILVCYCSYFAPQGQIMDIDTLMEIKGFDQIAGIHMPIIFIMSGHI